MNACDSDKFHVALKELDEFCLRRQLIFYPKTDVGIPEDKLSAFIAAKDKDSDFNRHFVERICSTFFGRKPVSVIPLLGLGTFHSIYRVSFRDDEQYVVKTNSQASRAFEFLIDLWATGVITQNTVPTVSVHCIDLSREFCPFDYEILSQAAGRPLAKFEDPNTQYVEPCLLQQLGTLVAKIHTIETNGFGLLDVRSTVKEQSSQGKGLLQTWKEYVLLNLEEHIRTCQDIGAMSREESSSISRVFERSGTILEQPTSRLLHGDLGNHNVFSEGEHVTAIIDWEDCLCGDPVFDIAYWGTFCRDYMLEPFLDGYSKIIQVPDDFIERYWLYYLRIALSKTVHRYRFHYSDRPGRPPASLRIQKALERLLEFTHR